MFWIEYILGILFKFCFVNLQKIYDYEVFKLGFDGNGLDYVDLQIEGE